ncbi:MAG TPA: aminomethyltransferase family protein [bacterium]
MVIPLLLHGQHAEAPAYEPVGSWIVPWRFDSLEAEYLRLRTSCGLLDYSTLSVIEVRGADRAGYLQRMLTNDVLRLVAGRGSEGALLTPQGRLVSGLIVLADEDAHWLLADTTRAPAVLAQLERAVFSEDVRFANHERRWAALALQGPGAPAFAARLAPAAAALSSEGDHVRLTLEGMAAWVVRHALTDEAGLLCLVEPDEARALWDRLLRRREPDAPGLVGWGALNTARIEAGIPWIDIDLDDQTLLAEAGLEARLSSDTKGCYVGQEIVARLKTYGSTSRRLCGLLIESTDVPDAGSLLARGDEEVGRITSACLSPALERPIALGWLKRGSYDPGTTVTVKSGAAPVPASVVALPFLPP